MLHSLETGNLFQRVFEKGCPSSSLPPRDSKNDEWVVLLQGRATLTYDPGATVTMGPGDYRLMPAHVRHRVDFTTSDPPCIWLAIHSLRATEPGRLFRLRYA
jgi:cupin 2 domain-containing protein